MSNKTFDEYDGFRSWVSLQDGDIMEFPFGENSPGWTVRVEDEEIVIESDFYKVQSCDPYGAPKIVGHCFPFAGKECSGVIKFGLESGEVSVVNRRRLTAEDELGDNEQLIEVIVGQPDRVEEPVAVVTDLDREEVAELSAGERLDLYQRVGDALEADAVRTLLKWVDGDLD